MGLVGKRLLLAALIGLIALAAWLGWKQLLRSEDPGDEPTRLRIDVVEVESPDIRLAARELEIVEQTSWTAWDMILLCQEPKGCYAEIELTFHYQGEAERGQAEPSQSSQCSSRQVVGIAAGGSYPLGFVQRPATRVRKIERTTIAVVTLIDPAVLGNQRRFGD